MNLSKSTKIIRIIDASAAGTTDVESAVVDSKGFDAVVFIVGLGAITAGAVTSCKIQQGALANMSDAADLENSGVTIADDDDDGLVVIEVSHPRERYLRAVVDRGTENAEVDFGLALLSSAKNEPIADDDTVIEALFLFSPAEGTA
jgi:hypothetical protein